MDTVEPTTEVVDNSTPVSTEGGGSLLNKTAPAAVAIEPATTEAVKETTTDDWKSFIDTLDEDIKGSRSLEKFKTTQELARSYTELSKLVGKKGEIPRDDASGEEWSEFYNKLGRPESPDQYGITPKDGLNGERLDSALKLAHEAGISKTQAEKLFGGLMDMEKADMDSMNLSHQERIAEEQSKLVTTWGNATDSMIESVIGLQKSLGVYESFEANGLNGNADLLIMMGELAKRLGEDPEISVNMANTTAGLDNSISEVNSQIKEYVMRGEKVPPHLSSKREELFNRKYKD